MRIIGCDLHARQQTLAMLDTTTGEVVKTTLQHEGNEQQARERSEAGARLLMTHPGVGPITALATEVVLGNPARFADSKELVSYVGMIPGEYSMLTPVLEGPDST